MYAVIITYKAPLEEIDQALPAHVEWLDQHYAQGTFLASGRREPRNGGVILARQQPLEALHQTLELDPFHSLDLATHEVVQFHPSKLADSLQGFSELFE